MLVDRYGSAGPWFDEEEYNMGLKGSSIWSRDLVTLGAGTRLEKFWFAEVGKKKMGKGDTIDFWADSWLGREAFKTLFPSLFNFCELKEAKV